MKTCRPLLTVALLLLVSLPAAAQINDTYVIPGSANQQGGFGTRWMTQFSLFNPHLDHELVVSITLLPTGGGTGIEELVRVPANSLAYSDNLLLDLFGVTGSGALLVATFPEDNPGVPNNMPSRAFLVTSNTYNNAPDGTFGQTVPGIWTGLLDYDADPISSISHGIRNSARDGWRTNIGATNLGRCNVTLRVSLYDANGNTLLNQVAFGIPPLGHFQDRLPVEVDAGTVEFFVDDPCVNSNENYAVVFPYTSMIDNLSGDPSYQGPTLLATTSVLFPNGMTAQALAEPRPVGKKIDTNYVRPIREQAERRGFATLERDSKGWRIKQ